MRLLAILLTYLIFLTLPTLSHCGWNNDAFSPVCIPAKHCAIENVCYCSSKFDGWMNGGGQTTREFRTRQSAYCAKFGTECKCQDCGNWGLVEDVQCQEKRCDDNVGLVEAGTCYHVDPTTGVKEQKPDEWNYNCYRSLVKCDTNICNYAQHLVGCMRVSPGSCADCPALQDGYFWTKKGSCDQTRCSSVGAGKFLGKACTATSDAVISQCSTHPGNIGYAVPRQDGRSTYYCPGGGLVLPLPDNSQPTSDFSGFVCLDGFYLNGGACLPCVPGSACKYGRSYTCPVNYYTSTYAMSACKLCTTPDKCGSWQHPLRCDQGSTADPGCVSCGACSYDPKRGLSCVMEAYEMLGPAVCTPTDVVTAVAVCQ